jgi:hypothetical protein
LGKDMTVRLPTAADPRVYKPTRTVSTRSLLSYTRTLSEMSGEIHEIMGDFSLQIPLRPK